MTNEFDILKYLRDIDDYVDRDTLIAVGADDTMLAALVKSERVQMVTLTDSTIAHGMRCSTFDATHNVRIPDNAWLKPSKSVSLRMLVKMDTWTPSATRTFINGYNGYKFFLNASNKWEAIIRSTGFVDHNYESTNVTGLSASNTYWIRMDWAFDNGAGLCSVNFKYSNEQVFDSNNVGVWTDVQTITASQHDIAYDGSFLYLGGLNTGGQAMQGNWYVAELWGEGQRRMFFDMSYNNRVNTGLNIFQDDYKNVLSLNGTTNYLMQNTNGVVGYRYIDYLGDTDPA